MIWLNSITARKYLSQTPVAVVDVGALGGIQGRWQTVPEVRFYGFEPQDEGFVPTMTSSGGLSKVALADINGLMPLHITRKKDGSSILRPDTFSLSRFATAERYEVVSTDKIMTDTLDAQIENFHIPYIDFIKIDTQGTELAVLRGADKTIGKYVFGIEVEVNFVSRYSGQAFFSEIDEFLRNRGFEIVDLSRRFMARKGGLGAVQSKGQMTHGTAVYFRTGHVAAGEHGDLDINAIVRHSAIAAAYGYLDISYEIIRKLEGLIPNTEFRELVDALEKDRRPLLTSKFPGIGRIRNLLFHAVRLTDKLAKTPQTGDRTLGAN